MSPRKAPPVSLPSIGRLTQREQRDIAENAIRKFRSAGYRASSAPTAERLLRAGGDARVVTIHENVEVAKGDKFEVEQVEVVQVRVDTDPLSRLCSKKLIDRDARRNYAMCNAGLQFRSAWQRTGLDNLKSPDLDRVSNSNGQGLFASEASAHALKRFQTMLAAIEPSCRRVTEAVVLNDRDPEDIGREVSGYSSPPQARVVALHLLRCGLRSIAVSVGLLEREPIPGAMKAAAE